MPKNDVTPILGHHIRIVHSTNPTQVGLEGFVIAETRNTLTIHSLKSNQAMVEKASITLQITRDDGSKTIHSGFDLVGRPYDRIKKASRRQK